MIETKTVLLGCLLFALPSGWSADKIKTSEHPGLIPGTVVKEVSTTLHGKGGEIYLFYWEPRPWRDGGPMQASHSWQREVAGERVTVAQTKFFMGTEQRVLVTHLHGKTPPAEVVIYTSNPDKKAFEAFLDGVRWKP